MGIGQKSLSGLQLMLGFPDGNPAGACMDKVDFVKVAHAGTDGMAGSTMLEAPVMQMQIRAAAQRALRIIFKYGHPSASFPV
ncbi:hypothetical protein D3C76_1412460 [compost metagenome]